MRVRLPPPAYEWPGNQPFPSTPAAGATMRKGSWGHSGATRAVQVQRFLGHHSPAFTLATYVHRLPDDLPAPGLLRPNRKSDQAGVSEAQVPTTRSERHRGFESG